MCKKEPIICNGRQLLYLQVLLQESVRVFPWCRAGKQDTIIC